MSDWYYAENGKPCGPFTSEAMRQLAANGRLKPTDLVCRQGMQEWVRAGCIPEIFAPRSIPVRPAPKGSSRAWIWLVIGVVAGIILLVVGYHNGSVEETESMLAAIHSGDYGTVVRLVNDGADPDGYPEEKKGFPLFTAVDEDKFQIAEFLLSKGASPNYWQHISTFWGAVHNDNIKMAELLVQYGADVNAGWASRVEDPTMDKDFGGITPLHTAAGEKRSPGMVQFLLQAGANPLLRNDLGQTPRDLLVYLVGTATPTDNDNRIYQMLQYAEAQQQKRKRSY